MYVCVYVFMFEWNSLEVIHQNNNMRTNQTIVNVVLSFMKTLIQQDKVCGFANIKLFTQLQYYFLWVD